MIEFQIINVFKLENLINLVIKLINELRIY